MTAGDKQRIQKLREDSQSALSRLPERVPGEGTRGAVGGQMKCLLGLLSDKRILIHNGFLSNWVDRKRTGIWGSIRQAKRLFARLNLGRSGGTENKPGRGILSRDPDTP